MSSSFDALVADWQQTEHTALTSQRVAPISGRGETATASDLRSLTSLTPSVSTVIHQSLSNSCCFNVLQSFESRSISRAYGCSEGSRTVLVCILELESSVRFLLHVHYVLPIGCNEPGSVAMCWYGADTVVFEVQ